MSYSLTGIAKLNELLGGGLSPGELLVFWSLPGVDGSPFLHTIVHSAIERDEKVLFFTENKSEATLKREMQRYGFSADSISFIDGYSGRINQPSESRYVVKRAQDSRDVTKTLKQALEMEPAIVLFDSLSSLIDVCSETALVEVEKWKDMLKQKNSAGIFLFTEWPYEKKLLEKVENLIDTIVKLEAVESDVIHQRFFRVVKRDGKPVKMPGVPFEILSPGGLRVQIPKIVVTGPEGSGKSTFIKSASSYYIGTERAGTTVGIDYGKVDYRGFRLSLFGTPSHKRFDPILPLVGENATGVIVLVDSTRPDTFPHTEIFLHKSNLKEKPKVVVSNHNGLPGSLSPEQIREKMNLPKKIPIIALTEKEGEGRPRMDEKEVSRVLDALFDQVF